MQRFVIAYPAGADASALRPPPGSDRDAEVVAVTLDFGDGRALEAVRDRALASGAVRAHVLDVREELARDYLLPALRAGAFDNSGRDIVVAALRRAIVGRKLAEVAALERAEVVAPAALPAPSDPGPGAARPSGVAAHIEVAFSGGVPDALNGVTMPFVDLLDSVRTIARAHGFGAGAAEAVIQRAHTELRRAVGPPELVRISEQMGERYARLIAAGQWFSIARVALDAFFEKAQEHMVGTVSLTLLDGRCDAPRVAPDEHPE